MQKPSSPPHADIGDGLPNPRRYWAILSLWLAVIVAGLDSSTTSIALPVIAHDLKASAAASIWVVNAYQIAIVIALFPAASLGEILGYRLLFCWGLGAFAVGAITCIFAPTLPILAACRFLQGLGAAGIMGNNAALVRYIFPKAMLGRGIGYNALIIAVCAAAGPGIAAAVLSVTSWRWLFAVNAPIAALAVLVGWHCLPRPPRADHRLDLASALLNAVAFGAIFLSASAFSRRAPLTESLSMLAVGVVAAFWLIVHERGRARPLVPFDLLRVPLLRLSYGASALAFAAMMMGIVSLPFYLNLRFGFSHLETGLMISSMAITIAVSAPVAGHLVEKISAGVLGGVGLVASSAGWLMMGLFPENAPMPLMIAAMILCGTGFGLFQTPNNRTMIGAAPHDRSGAAGGMLSMARLLGQTCGALLVVLLFELGGPDTRLTMFVAAGFVLVGGLVSLSRTQLPPPPPRPAEPGTISAME